MWGNDQYGDCVSAEEAFAKACYNPEIFLSASVVVAWAQRYGFRDGANLTDVMDQMIKQGFPGAGNQLYDDGPYSAVDYSNEVVLQSALDSGPVKIGIDSSALPQGAGNQQGWVAVGGRPHQFQNEDHCVALAGYGSAQWLFQQLNVTLPSNAGITPTTPGYLLFTWSTIGFVDHAWIMSTVGEAWLRNPTTVGVPPLPGPTPPPPVASNTINFGAGQALGIVIVDAVGSTLDLKQAYSLGASLTFPYAPPPPPPPPPPPDGGPPADFDAWLKAINPPPPADVITWFEALSTRHLH
jgi:hypothetical protein